MSTSGATFVSMPATAAPLNRNFRRRSGASMPAYMTSRKVAKESASAAGGAGGAGGAGALSVALDKQERVPVPMLGKEFRVRRWSRAPAAAGSDAAAAAAPGGAPYAHGMVLPLAWVPAAPAPSALLQVAFKTALEKARLGRFGRRTAGTKRTRGIAGDNDTLDELNRRQREQRREARLAERAAARAAIISAGGTLPDDDAAAAGGDADDAEEEAEAEAEAARAVADAADREELAALELPARGRRRSGAA
jgi:hypothetical protein